MDLVFLAILLLFIVGCIAIVVLAISRKGWLFTARGGLLGLLVAVLLFDSEPTRMKIAIPLMGAACSTIPAASRPSCWWQHSFSICYLYTDQDQDSDQDSD
jgi:hypothetical protein